MLLLVVQTAVVIPLSYAEHLRRTGRVDSVHIFDQHARLGPLALTGVCALAAVGLLYLAGAPSAILRLGALLFLLAGAVLVATFLFKVSGHVSAWTSGTTVLVILYGPPFSVLLLFAAPIAWSRHQLGKHTSLELVVGFVYGIVTAVVLSYAVGLP